jgi:sugar lactone lactonase YvrE
MASDGSAPDEHVLLSGLAFPESPRWHKGRLWLCDWVAQQVIAVDLDVPERGHRRDPRVAVLDRLASGRAPGDRLGR